jgi:hypothetical protein
MYVSVVAAEEAVTKIFRVEPWTGWHWGAMRNDRYQRKMRLQG